jgi:drug/metabolite transporter (DMT)-like permease
VAPSIVVFMEHAMALTFMLIVIVGSFLFDLKVKRVFQNDKKDIKKLNKKDWLVLMWIALFGGLIGTLAITKALFFVGFIPLSIPILVQKIQPIFAVITAKLLLKERLKKGLYLWGGIALLGSYLVTFGFNKPVISFDNKSFMAALLGLAAAFAWGTSTTFGRKIALKELAYRSIVFLRFLLTTVLALGFIVVTGTLNTIGKIDNHEFKLLIIVALSTGLLASFLYYKGLKKTPARVAAFAELFFPLTIVVGDYLLRGQIMSVAQFLGAGLILLAISKSSKM